VIHIVSNPDSPQDDWKTECGQFELSPSIRHSDWVLSAEIAKEQREAGKMVCFDCLPYDLFVEGDDGDVS